MSATKDPEKEKEGKERKKENKTEKRRGLVIVVLSKDMKKKALHPVCDCHIAQKSNYTKKIWSLFFWKNKVKSTSHFLPKVQKQKKEFAGKEAEEPQQKK